MQYDGAFERLLRIQDYDTACRSRSSSAVAGGTVRAGARDLFDLSAPASDRCRAHALRRWDVPGLSALLSFGVLDRSGLSAACDLARQMGQTEALALLLAALDRSAGRAAPLMQKTYDL